MSLAMERSMLLLARFHFCLVVILVLFLILSSLSLHQFSDSSSISQSLFRVILANSTSDYLDLNVETEKIGNLGSAGISPRESLRSQGGGSQVASKDLDGFGEDRTKACNPNQALLKVFMYDLPPEFHFGLLGWKARGNETWPDVSDPTRIPSYPGGLNLQHSIEYWLTLDLLSSDVPNVIRPCTAVRVHSLSEADVVFVPFFSSLSYNRFSKLHGKENVSINTMLQDKLVRFLKRRDEWKRLGGKDHLIVAHHPNSMRNARRKLGSAMFVLADFGRYPIEIANLEKDVIAPYKHMVRTIPVDKSPSFEQRHRLVYFQGAIYRKDGGAIRQELYYLLRDEKDAHFEFGSIGANGVSQAGQGMASSKFCLNIAGDTPSSNRLFDAIVSHCIPVIISDEIELPFEDVLDYSEFSIFVRAADAVKKGHLLNLLKGIKRDEWMKMWERLKRLTPHFEYRYPSQPGDAVDMIWQAVLRKISSTQSKVHRQNRYCRSQLSLSGHSTI